MSAKSYQRLAVWTKGMQLTKQIYSLTGSLPSSEQYGLSSQMQRAAFAIPSIIAEGYLRGHRPEFIQFLSVSVGSAAELETQLQICMAIYPAQATQAEAALSQVQEIIRMLLGLIKTMRLKSKQ
jgi:four helix bundle protein